MLSEKVELVKQVIINLANNVESGRDPWDWERIPLEDFYRRDEVVKAVSKGHATLDAPLLSHCTRPMCLADHSIRSFSASLTYGKSKSYD